MADVADLGLRITGQGDLDSATLAMDRLAAAAGRVESAAQRAKRQMDEQTRATRQAAAGTSNLAAQFQDIVVSLQGGQMPMTVALQQGSQISAIFGQGATAVQLMGAAFRSLAASLPIIAAIAAAGYAFQWMQSAYGNSKKLEEAIKDQQKAIIELGNAYGLASIKVTDFGRKSLEALESSARVETAIIRLKAAQETASFVGQITTRVTPGRSAGGYDTVAAQFSDFADPINKFLNSGKTAKDFDELTRSVSRIGSEGGPELQKVADRFLEMSKNAADLNQQLKITDQVLKDINRSSVDGPGAVDRLREQGQGLTGLMRRMNPGAFPEPRNVIQEEIESKRRNEVAWADYNRMFAKSPQEIGDAVRKQEEAKVIPGERDQERIDRITIASTQALAEATFRLVEAQKQRARSLDTTLASQQLNLELIGRTKGEQEGLKLQFQLTQAIQEEAARNNIEVSQKELDLIKQKSEEYGKLADAIAKVTLQDNLLFERSQVFRNEGDQSIAARQRGAGLPVDLNSPEAQFMRQTERLKDLRDGVRGFFDDIEEGILSGDDIGKAIGKAVVNALNKVFDKFLDNIFNSLVDDIVGSPGGGGLFDKIFGSPTAAGGSLFNVANAGGQASTAGGFAQMLAGMGMVPDNVGNSAGGVIGAAGSALSLSGKNVRLTGAPLATVMFGGKPAQVEAQFASRFQRLSDFFDMKGYDVNSVGEAGYSDRKVAGTNSWSQHAYGRAVDINPRDNPYSYSGRNNYNFDPQEAARYSGLEYGGSWKKPDSMHWQVPRGVTKESETAITRLTAASNQATKSVGQMAATSGEATKGLGQFGNALSQFPAAPGGGGAGGLGGIFKGGGGGFPLPSFDFMSSISPAAATFIMGGGVGLFHEGGIAGFATQHRYGVDPRVFIGAPRYHRGGIAGDEVPAILKRGEPVFQSMQHARDTVGGGGLNVVVNNFSSSQVNQERGGDDGRDLVITIDEAVGNLAQKPGTYTNKALRAGGVRPALERRY